MNNSVVKFVEVLDTLDEWNIKPSDLHDVMTGTRNLSREGAIAWSHLATVFNREAYPLITEQIRATQGLPVVITEEEPNRRLELLRRSLLYADLTVVFSGGPAPHDYTPILEAVRKGGIICDQIPEFFDDLLALRPILTSGLGVCLQRHFFDASPGDARAAWIMTNLNRSKKTSGDPVKASEVLNPYSVYTDFFRPASLDCIYLGSDYDHWKNRITSSLKSPQELAFATILNLKLPYLTKIPLDVLAELRVDQPELFLRARKYIWEAVRECIKFDGAQADVEEFAHFLQRNYLDTASLDAQEDIKQATATKYVRRFSPVVSTLSMTFNALIGNPIGSIIDLLNLGQQGTSEFLESRSENLRKSGNDLYLFTKLEELANTSESKKA